MKAMEGVFIKWDRGIALGVRGSHPRVGGPYLSLEAMWSPVSASNRASAPFSGSVSQTVGKCKAKSSHPNLVSTWALILSVSAPLHPHLNNRPNLIGLWPANGVSGFKSGARLWSNQKEL